MPKIKDLISIFPLSNMNDSYIINLDKIKFG